MALLTALTVHLKTMHYICCTWHTLTCCLHVISAHMFIPWQQLHNIYISLQDALARRHAAAQHLVLLMSLVSNSAGAVTLRAGVTYFCFDATGHCCCAVNEQTQGGQEGLQDPFMDDVCISSESDCEDGEPAVQMLVDSPPVR